MTDLIRVYDWKWSLQTLCAASENIFKWFDWQINRIYAYPGCVIGLYIARLMWNAVICYKVHVAIYNLLDKICWHDKGNLLCTMANPTSTQCRPETSFICIIRLENLWNLWNSNIQSWLFGQFDRFLNFLYEHAINL